MTSRSLEDRLASELAELETTGLTRRRRVLESPCGRIATVDGKKVLNFAANDYLGLAGDAGIARALADGALHWGAGAGASHLVSGHLAPHEALEKAIAAFTGFPRALTFSTGYLANLAVTPTLAGRGDAVFADKLNHASLIDAMQLAKANGAEVQRYPHNDVAALEKLLAASTAAHKVIVTDAVFSMDGDLAPLPLIFALAERYDAWLVIDDAHGFGVLGPHGRGSLAHFNLPASPRILLMGTLGKAAGVGGAFVAGSETAIEYLLQKGRSYIFTTAQPPAIACALSKSLQLIRDGDALRANLMARIGQLRDGLAGLPLQLLPSLTAIQPLIVGDNEAAVTLAKALWERDLWVPAIRPPTVPKGTARLRISVSAAHTEADINQLVTALKELA
ncbi:MAG: 8-amino-7-oxononanoate synthase [Gammaproteobacteria bacterium]|nr:8-amino-7-oxononanoate synthase [Gammaproteobacteria bacterium]MBU1601667.1 8-amino-7-oxononanoate synthase [Gammaproteobacteria bacterium]MBU2434746.1 8-amino-7-oxononanoate synthase [Gammaproteobacteria bacterium]MBU2447987.1 8-amino-7-oxononanoate synthase [Gammaproteobacteria bacterium]